MPNFAAQVTPGLSLAERFRGMLLGVAVGDALGLPAEGLSRRRLRQLFPGSWRHRLLFGGGMVSDDTELALFTAQSLVVHPDRPDAFARRLEWCLRGWLLSGPSGIGLATLRATLRLWIGVPPHRSGVASAGNGPATRAALIGAFFADTPAEMASFLESCTRITHTDPRALTGARAIAMVAAWCVQEELAVRPAADLLVRVLGEAGTDPEWRRIVETVGHAARANLPVAEFADALGLEQGVSGFMYHTVPVAVYAWYRHFGDFAATVGSVLDCGGDTDTTGAVAGALAGLLTGEHGIPHEWVRGVRDWPRGPALLRRVADELAAVRSTRIPGRPVRYCWPALLPRNALFFLAILVHRFRRLAPPY
jgi:ADP-ribosylglycohydrolase